jgi:ribonucleoside-diphosphate reductase alpha chain
MIGPQTQIGEYIHSMKYRGEGEDFREAMGRVASGLSDNPEHYHVFREILLEQRFLPAGRVQSAIGSTRQVTPYNCYVSGTINDSFVEGAGNIMQRALEAAATMRMGGGIGYDFSTLRPRGDMIKKLQSKCSGPISFMDIFDAVCRCTSSSGHRRGAQMGVLRVDHPDIEEFVRAKQNKTQLQGFNISVAVTDKFMQCVNSGEPFPLKFENEVYRTIDAAALWEMIMRSTWDWAEPGVLFIDRINEMNNLHYCETIAATNPCGEQPLPPYGACLLGSFNLVKYMEPKHPIFNGDPRWSFNWDQFISDIPHVVRAMDNVVDKALYPLPEQEREAKNKRRMGLGITGLANAAEALGYPYGSAPFLDFEYKVLRTLNIGAYRSSVMLAKEKGPFPAFMLPQYLQGNFIKTLPEEERRAIAQHGIRNSHLTSIAPCGTISMAADNVSSGIEPVFSYLQERTVIEFEGAKDIEIEDYGHRVFGVNGKQAKDVTVQEHLDVLTVAAKNVDSSVSKTCNVPPSTPWADFKNIYMQAWKAGCKGCTTFMPEGKRMGILREKTNEEGENCKIDTTTGRRDCE